jgi:hypothetical protein
LRPTLHLSGKAPNNTQVNATIWLDDKQLAARVVADSNDSSDPLCWTGLIATLTDSLLGDYGSSSPSSSSSTPWDSTSLPPRIADDSEWGNGRVVVLPGVVIHMRRSSEDMVSKYELALLAHIG